MFTKLWKQSGTEQADEAFQFTFRRQRGEPIQFNGTLLAESNGESQVRHKSGDPWHRLQVYRIDPVGFAVVIEFHISSSLVAVDAGIVSSVAEADDFFCMHAGEHFHRMSLDAIVDDEDEPRPADKQLEQRVLANYDRQILIILDLLNAGPTDPDADRQP